MITTPAREGWYGRTHRTAQLWQVGPSSGLRGRSVRTCSSYAEDNQSNAARLSHSWSTAISTAHRAVAPGGANAGRNYGPQRGLAPDRMRLCRTLWAANEYAVAQRSDLCSLVSPAVAQSTCARGGCGAISCTCAKVTPEKQQTAGRDVKRGVSA